MTEVPRSSVGMTAKRESRAEDCPGAAAAEATSTFRECGLTTSVETDVGPTGSESSAKGKAVLSR